MSKILKTLKDEGSRPLIFSQWTQILDILERFLQGEGYAYLRLDGETPVEERQELIDKYTNDRSIFIFLLSTRAGGLGINLAAAADAVIQHDLDFNPTTDRQAEDRVHRIGQTKAVTIFKLVAEETVDEQIYHISEKKKRLEAALLGEGESDDKAQRAEASEIGKIISSVVASNKA